MNAGGTCQELDQEEVKVTLPPVCGAHQASALLVTKGEQLRCIAAIQKVEPLAIPNGILDTKGNPSGGVGRIWGSRTRGAGPQSDSQSCQSLESDLGT